MAFSAEENAAIRETLLREARRCAVTLGLRKTSVEQLTEAAGISKGLFYKYFASKELLFFEVLEDIHSEVYQVAEQALEETGAQGVQVGTRFLVATECTIHENYKLALLKAKDSDTTVTGRSIGGPVRVLKNKMAREYLALEKRGATLEELEHVTLGGLRRAVFEGDMERGSVMAGQVAGMLHEIKPLRQIFEELYTGSQAVLKATEAAWQ